MHIVRVIIIISLLFQVTIAGETPDSISTDKVVSTPEIAMAKALNYLGFLEMDGFSIEKNYDTALFVNITDDKTPFLHNRINNRDIWKVTFKDITLSPYRGYPDSVDYPRTFNVYIDPTDGTLLKIESLYTGNNVDFAPEPSIEWAEKQIEGTIFKFLGFASPDSNYVSLNEVLQNLGPRNFKLLKALLVRTGRDEAESFTVWYIIYRGTDPFYPVSGGGNLDLSNKEDFNYQTFIYDAKTGETIAWTINPTIEPEK